MLTGKGALSNYCSESKPPGEQGAGEEFPEKHQDFTDVSVCKARLGAHQAKRVSVCVNFGRREKGNQFAECPQRESIRQWFHM